MPKVSAPVQFILFLLLQLVIACLLWLAVRDQPSGFLGSLADAGALLSWIPLPLHLIYKFQTKGAHRLRWQVPDYVGLGLAWGGFLLRQEAAAEQSWKLHNIGCILEIAGGLVIIYALIVLLRMPKNQR